MKPRIPRDFLYYFPYGLEYLLNLNKIFIDYGKLINLSITRPLGSINKEISAFFQEAITESKFESVCKNELGEKIYHVHEGT